MPSSDLSEWDQAYDLASDRGCDPDALCWEACLDNAYDDILENLAMRSEYRFNQ